MIRVLIAEDHTIVRKGLRSLLDAEPGIEVIAEAKDGQEAVEKTERLRPDVVVTDISMPGLNGLEATRRIKKRFPEVQVVILSMHTNDEYIFQVLGAGASGYVLKQSAVQELVSAIQMVSRGQSYLSPSVSKRVVEEFVRRGQALAEPDSYDSLTNREREVLQLVAEGHKSREIAELLYISEKTVQTHRAHIMQKLGIRGAAELTQYAVRKGVIGTE